MAVAASATTIDGAQQSRLMRRATYASVAVAAILIVAKTTAWAMTDSVSVLSSLVDSLLDAVASLINLLAVHHALTPADREHRFGHGKAEPIAGLAQAAFITGSALFLLLEAGHRLYAPLPVVQPEIGIGVMVLSIVLTLGLVLYQRHVVSSTGSVAISADSLHYRGDLLVNGSVIVSIVLAAWFGFQLADPLFAIAIGLYILWSAIRIGRMAFDLLMDRELADDERQRIRKIAMSHPEVRSLHDLRTRSAGPNIFIQFHLEMDAEISLRRAHEISDAVESEVMAAFPNSEVIIHQDPEGVEEPRRTFPAPAPR
jgi:ferrous-iron efflux pump FieF